MNLLAQLFGSQSDFGGRDMHNMAAQQMQSMEYMRMLQSSQAVSPISRDEVERSIRAQVSKQMAEEMCRGLTREFTRHQFPEFPIIPQQR